MSKALKGSFEGWSVRYDIYVPDKKSSESMPNGVMQSMAYLAGVQVDREKWFGGTQWSDARNEIHNDIMNQDQTLKAQFARVKVLDQELKKAAAERDALLEQIAQKTQLCSSCAQAPTPQYTPVWTCCRCNTCSKIYYSRR